MERPAATIPGSFHHGSVRSVRAVICARVLVGASGACVMPARPACFEERVTPTMPPNLFQSAGLCSNRDLIVACDPGYTPVTDLLRGRIYRAHPWWDVNSSRARVGTRARAD